MRPKAPFSKSNFIKINSQGLQNENQPPPEK
jgi:hypothetical protein